MDIKCRDIRILVNPNITSEQLWDFYIRNDVCEVGFGKEVAVKPLKHSSLIIGAFNDDKLVGIARAMFDGLSAVIMEFCLERELQGENLEYSNGSLIEENKFEVGKRMGELLINELRNMGATFISLDIVKDCEERFYKSMGFRENCGHLSYYIDERPYV